MLSRILKCIFVQENIIWIRKATIKTIQIDGYTGKSVTHKINLF